MAAYDTDKATAAAASLSIEEETEVKRECLEEQDSPHLEVTTQFQLNGSNPSLCVGIGAKLKGSMRREIITFLKRNKSTLSLDVASHQLNVDPSFKLVKQKEETKAQTEPNYSMKK